MGSIAGACVACASRLGLALGLTLGMTPGLAHAEPASAVDIGTRVAAAAYVPASMFPPDVLVLLQGIVASGDARGRPFAIVDKHDARLWVFGADSAPLGNTPALLGSMPGDESAAGVGHLVTTGIPASLRTTPAGRFDSQPGRNLNGEAVIWVDYAAAVAIHRLRPAPAHERRAERLASATPTDNRISLGCVVVSAAFYDAVVAPVLGRSRAVVYILPDTKSVHEALGTIVGSPL